MGGNRLVLKEEKDNSRREAEKLKGKKEQERENEDKLTSSIREIRQVLKEKRGAPAEEN